MEDKNENTKCSKCRRSSSSSSSPGGMNKNNKDSITGVCCSSCPESLFRCTAETFLESLPPRTVEIAVGGMTCTNCALSVKKALMGVPGVLEVSVSLTTGTATITYETFSSSQAAALSEVDELLHVLEAIEMAGYQTGELHVVRSKREQQESESIVTVVELSISGMTSTNCAQSVEKSISGLGSEIVNVSVSLTTDTATIIEYHDPPITLDQIRDAVSDVGYGVTEIKTIQRKDTSTAFQSESDAVAVSSIGDWERIRDRQYQRVCDCKMTFLYSLLGTIPILTLTMVLPHLHPSAIEPLKNTYISWGHNHSFSLEALLLWIFATPVQFVSGWEFYRMSYHGFKSGGRAGMDLLTALGTTASYFYALYAGVWESTSTGNGIAGSSDGNNSPFVDSNDKHMASHFFETSAALISFVLCGKWVQALAVRRAKSRGLSEIMQLQAKTAVKVAPIFDSSSTKSIKDFDPRVDKYWEETVPIEQVLKGDLVKVIRGAPVPADGVVLVGEVSIDESMVTGESVPALKTPGSVVIGGTVCVEASVVGTHHHEYDSYEGGGSVGAAFVQVTGVGSSTALAQIVQLVQYAQTRAVPIQSFADRIAAIFVPSVCAVSVVTFVVWYALCQMHLIPSDWYRDLGESPLTFSIMFGTACLVISCPCALGLATPTAVMVGTCVGANNGVLMKDGEVIEIASSVNSVVFEKTRALTKGSPAVVDYFKVAESNTLSNPKVENHVLWLLASLERTSEHPLATAVVKYCESQLGEAFLKLHALGQPANFKALTGRGASAVVDGHRVAAGNRAFAQVLGLSISDKVEAFMTLLENEGKTAILAAINDTICVVMGIADEVKPDAAASIAYLREDLKVEVWMVTGDNKRTAAAISRQLGLPSDHVIAEAMPASKVEQVRKLQDQGKVVCMVGDGVNDSPALAQADLGMSIGTGAEIAAEASEMVLVKGHVEDVCTALHLSRIIFRRIQLNLIWSLLYNCFCIPVAAGVFFPLLHSRFSPTVAAVAMALSSVSVVCSSLALRLYRPPNVIAGSRTKKSGWFRSSPHRGDDEQPLIGSDKTDDYSAIRNGADTNDQNLEKAEGGCR